MKRILSSVLLTTSLLFAHRPDAGAQINVTTGLTPTQMAQELVGTGLTVANATMSCDTLKFGQFSVSPSSAVGFSSGIVLTTGRVKTVGAQYGIDGPASNFVSGSSANCNSENDPDLSNLSGVTTNDACILEFDFTPLGDTIQFRYVMGSDEYPEFACTSFNDVFAFFISGPGITGNPNIALIPGTTIPVSINSINDNANPGPSCTNMGAGSPFSQYYIDNAASQILAYDGLTTVLTAKTAVIPCSTYHLKMAIADGSDCSYDSGVFLEAGSLSSNNPVIAITTPDGKIIDSPYVAEGCYPLNFGMTLNNPSTKPLVYHFTYTGTATNGIDYTTLPDSVVINPGSITTNFKIQPVKDNNKEGVETIIIQVFSANCSGVATDTVTIWVRDQIIPDIFNNDTAMCEGQAIQINAIPDEEVKWTWYPRYSISDSLIPNPVIQPLPAGIYVYHLDAYFPNCPLYQDSIVLDIQPYPFLYPVGDSAVCYSTDQWVPIGGYYQPASFSRYAYHWSPAKSVSSPDSLFTYFIGQQSTVLKLLISSSAGCADSGEVKMTILPLPEFAYLTSDTTIKYGAEVEIRAASNAWKYIWSPNKWMSDPTTKNPLVRPLEPITYKIMILDENGCWNTDSVKVALDYRQDKLLVPNAFTPNGDGTNDIFRPANLNFNKLVDFKVFNRWGQEVYTFIQNSKGWDGTMSGEPMPGGNYQYFMVIESPDGKSEMIKGDVILLR